MAAVVLTVITCFSKCHGLSGYWRSPMGGDFVFVQDSGRCQFKIWKYSGESLGKFYKRDGMEAYRARFKQPDEAYAVLLSGSSKSVFFGFAKAHVLLVSPWYDPSLYERQVLNIARILQVSFIGVCMPVLLLYILRIARLWTLSSSKMNPRANQ